MSDDTLLSAGFDRRRFLGYFSAVGLGGTLLPGVLWARVAGGEEITPATIACAEEISGLKFTDAQRQQMVDGLKSQELQIQQLRTIALDNAVAPAVHFDPVPPGVTLRLPAKRPMVRSRVPARTMPRDLDELAFLPVTELSELVRRRKVTATQLTEMYLGRIARFDPVLKAVITVTRERALRQAREADAEIARGKYRGPLHGIPWGAKDLIAYPGYPTTWGAAHFKDRTLDVKATVAKKLEVAGAVLVAKTTLGTLALGDQWFGGMTRNPWNPKQGSSGSSAGSASAVSAGLVGFAIGSETLGSIISPCTRCGVTGLRPTYGRISRHGCMTLSWSMDKLGPIARSVEDCALIFGAIHGADASDPTSVNRPFTWPNVKPLKELRVGIFEQTSATVKKVLTDLGVKLVPIVLPNDLPVSTMSSIILDCECATAFDDLTRAGIKEESLGNFWPNTFRAWRFTSAVEYLRANRLRTKLMQAMAKVMETVDVYVGGDDLSIANLTGHPTVCLPNGFTKSGEVKVPTAITFTGQLYGETDLLSVAKAYQDVTGHHTQHPTLDAG